MLPNPAGGRYGPTSGNPNLYPPGTEHLRPANVEWPPKESEEDNGIQWPPKEGHAAWPPKESQGGKKSGASSSASSSTPVTLKENNMDKPEHVSLYIQGLEMRRNVVGEDYVESALQKGKSDFLRPLQQFATESAWGTIWTRPGLELKTRSLLNLVMLTALGKWIELGTHVRGAVRNGCSEVEIRESLLQASAYCGMPAGLEAFRVADRVLTEMEEKGELVREK